MINAVISAAKDAGVTGTENLVSFALAFKAGMSNTNATVLVDENAALKAKIAMLEAKISSGGGAAVADKEEEAATTTGKPPLDIGLFKDEKKAEMVRESQRRRYWVDKLEDIDAETVEEKQKIQDGYKKQQAEQVALVDNVIEAHKAWVKSRYDYDQSKRACGKINKEMGKLMKAKKFDEAKVLKEQAIKAKAGLPALDEESKKLEATRDAYMCKIGNVCPSDRGMKWTRNEDLSPTPDGYHWGVGIPTKGVATPDARRNTADKPEKLLNHVDLCHRLNIRDTDTSEAGGPAEGVRVSGGRAYFLKGHGVSLNQALINYGLAFLEKRGYTQLQCPFFINRSKMGLCAQLEDFDEQLYKVTGEGEPKYLIATSEQAICCYHENKFISKKKLPVKYAGYSSCFRKEVGSHGRDTLGIFRVHQFEKVEQFCIADPEKSWEMMEQMIKSSMDYYESLKIPYKVINIVSGELNNAAAQKYDLEAWFPASRTYRELVSCSNCLDYQSRRVQCKIEGAKKGQNEFVHMLNSTLSATERTMCCIIENYQTDKGVVVPEVLRPYMPNGLDFIPFQLKLPVVKKSKKKGGKKK